jgi:hypothetical protein
MIALTKHCLLPVAAARETGARTEAELVAFVLNLWLVERKFLAPGLYDWLYDRNMKAIGWRDPTELEEGHVERIRAEVATEEGRTGFLAAIQGDRYEPVFFVKSGCGNPFLTDFVLRNAVDNGGGLMMSDRW